MLFSILIALMVVLGILLIALILLQQGKGADAGAAFGSGASGTVFGSRGSATFLSRVTGVAMGLFMVLAVVMAYVSRHAQVRTGSVMQGAPVVATATQHAAPAGAARTAGVPGHAANAGTGHAAQPAAPAPARTAPPPSTGG